MWNLPSAPPIDLPTAPCPVASVSLSRQVRNFLLGSMGRGGRALAFLVALRTAEAGGKVVSHSPIDHDLYPSLCRNNWGRNLHHFRMDNRIDQSLFMVFLVAGWSNIVIPWVAQ